MTRSTHPVRTRRGARAVAAFAALAAAGATLPMIGGVTAASATTSCSAPSGLASDDALRGPAAQLKDVRLAWQPVAGAAGYELEVSPDQDFSNNIFVDTTTVSTRYNVPPTVLKPSSYFWRVRVAGASCWSDDGGANASQFAVAWKEAPAISTPSGSVAANDLHFSWSAIPEASAYEVELSDATTGQLIGRCVTTHTSFSPYDEVAGDAERVPDNTGCIPASKIGFRRNYSWRVRGLDTTGPALNGKPYGYLAGGVSAAQPLSGQHGNLIVNHVYKVSGGTVDTVGPTVGGAGTQIAIDGTDNGSRFVASDTVTVGGVAATGITVDATTGDLLATVPPNVAGGVQDVLVNDGTQGSIASAADQFLSTGGEVSLGNVETFSGTVIGPWSGLASFSVSEPSTGATAAVSGLTTLQTDTSGLLSGGTCGTAVTCVDTPTFHWTADPGAVSYRVYVWDDQDQTSLDREYETTSTWLTPRDELLDDQAGQAYYWQVQSCSYNYCENVLSPIASFRKDAKPVTGESPRSGATVNFDNVVLSWQHWQTTEGTGLAAAFYHVQIATSCTFDSGILDDGFSDVPEYVNPTNVYPNGTYYWRVQAVDASSSPLAWDAPNHTTNDCSDVPSFTLTKQLAGASGPNGAANGGTPSTNAPAVIIDVTNKAITKGGKWFTRKAAGASKGTALVADGKKKQSLTYVFQRPSIMVGYCTGPMDGQLSIYVDGKLRRNINTYKRFTSCKATFLVGGLSRTSTHKLVVQARDKKGFSHGTPQIVVDYVKIA